MQVNPAKLIIISSPSGAGKTSISRALVEKSDYFRLSISATTRVKRLNETEAVDYFFKTKHDFDHMVKAHEFLEHAIVFENSYGTPKDYIAQQLVRNINVVLDIDWQGANQLRRSMTNDVVSVFILPPSAAELMSRLVKRGQDSFDVIKKRIDGAFDEIKHWKEYDYIIINDNLDDAYRELNSILVAERCKIGRSDNNQVYVKQLSNDLKKRL